jgi:hypothetical protein
LNQDEANPASLNPSQRPLSTHTVDSGDVESKRVNYHKGSCHLTSEKEASQVQKAYGRLSADASQLALEVMQLACNDTVWNKEIREYLIDASHVLEKLSTHARAREDMAKNGIVMN